jgi:hypothetical protein
MQYEFKTATSFSFIENSGADKITQEFSLRSELTNWQLGKVSSQFGKLLKDSPDFIKAIINIIGTISSDPSSMTDQVKERIGEVLAEAFLGKINAEIFTGVGDLLAFIGEHSIIPKIAAAMYLKEGEARLDDKTYQARIALFEELPVKHFVGAITFFFPKGSRSTKDTPEPLATSETKTISNTPQT